MNPDFISPIVPLLRAELAAYGGLLGAFEQQQQHLLRREVDQTSATSERIQALAAEAAEHRAAREAWVRDYAVAHGEDPAAPLRRLLPSFAEAQQPLVEALIREINVLIHRVRRRAHQNHGILARAVELHRSLQGGRGLLPPTRTYSPRGRVSEWSDLSQLHATG